MILGGSNSFGTGAKITKTIKNLPAHDYIVVSFKAYFIDTWDGNEGLNLNLDSKRRWTFTPWTSGYRLAYYNFNLCGGGNADTS